MNFLGRSAILLSGAILCGVAQGQHICWVKAVRASGAGIAVTLQPEYRNTLAGITRAGAEKPDPVSNPGMSFDLSNGDVAHLLGLHSGCQIKATRESGRMGARLEASSSHPWFGTSTQSAFVLAE